MISKEIYSIAIGFRDGKIHPIIAARRIANLRFATDNPCDKVFNVFIELDSDSEQFPYGEWRSMCSADFLKRGDEKMKTYLNSITPDLILACGEIIERYQVENEDGENGDV